jgi:glyoxylase-like metal-dependent hydrolase (beta-lactamase superfamily II)
VAKLSIVKVRMDREVNSYLVTCSDSSEAVVVDPGEPAEKIAAQLQGLTVRWLVATHGHQGHVSGKDALKELTGATTALSMADAKAYLRSADHYLVDGDELEFGRFQLKALHTPGHTPGSFSFLVANHVFTGDTLLAGGFGKEMPGSDLRQQLMSIGGKLLTLPPTTAIYPGHGPVTNLEAELRSNPVFRGVRA